MRVFGGLATTVLLECFWFNVLRCQGHSNTTDRLQSRDNSRERHQFASSYRSASATLAAGSAAACGVSWTPVQVTAILRRAWLLAFSRDPREGCGGWLSAIL